MYSYPLKFKVDGTPADIDLKILDAEKNEILFRPKISEAMAEGSAACVIYTNKESRQPVYNTLFQTKNEVDSYIIRTPGETVLGELVTEAPHLWKLIDQNGIPVAAIQEKSSWKNSCLFQVLTFPLLLLSNNNIEDELLKMVAPHRYIVILNGKKVLELRETVSSINDDYSLKKSGDFTEREEALMVVALITALGLKE
jgi:hypothetical protein